MLFTLPGPKKFNNRSGIIYSVVCPGKISWISWKSQGKSLTDERKLLHQRPDFLQLTDKLLFIEWGVQTPYYANDDCVISVVKFLWPAPILYPYLVSQNVVTENLLGHRGEERDGVGHGEAHLFCISHLASQTAVASRLNSTLVVKFLHYFLKEFLRLSSREREGDLGTARDLAPSYAERKWKNRFAAGLQFLRVIYEGVKL